MKIELSITGSTTGFRPLRHDILDAKIMDTIVREINFWTKDDMEKSPICHVGVFVKFDNGSVTCVSSCEIYEKEVDDFLISCGIGD